MSGFQADLGVGLLATLEVVNFDICVEVCLLLFTQVVFALSS